MNKKKKRFLALLMALVMTIALCVPKESSLSLYRAFAGNGMEVATPDDADEADIVKDEGEPEQNDTVSDTSDVQNQDDKTENPEEQPAKAKKGISMPGESNLGDGEYTNPQLVEIAANHIDVTLPSGQTINRDSSFSINISYTIPEGNLAEAKRHDANNNVIWVYDLSTFIANNPALRNLAENAEGNIIQGASTRGTYIIHDNKVYLNIDNEWLATQTQEVKGTFALEMSLDASSIGSEDSISFSFPGSVTDFTLEFSTPSSSNNSKSVNGASNDKVAVTPKQDGTYDITYKVSVTPNTNHNQAFNVIDTLNSSDQSFDVSSFSVRLSDWPNPEYDLSSYVSLSNGDKTATIDLYSALVANNESVKANKTYDITYTTNVPANALGTQLTNTVKTTWENSGTSPDTTTNVTPVSVLNVDKAYTSLGDDKYKYTITIGDANTDMSNLQISDTMKDLQYLVGNVTFNGTVIDVNTSFTDTTFSENTSEFFTYNTGASFGLGPITIEYTVRIPDSSEAPSISGEKDITNNVNVTGDDKQGSDYTSFKHTFGTPDSGSIDKEFVSFDETNNKINWKITVSNTGSEALTNAYISENATSNSLDNTGWFRDNDITVDWSNVSITDTSDVAISSSDYTIDSNNKKIIFNTFPANTTYYVYISSSPKTGDLISGVTYKNDATLKNQYDVQLASDSDQKKYSSNDFGLNKTYTYDKESGEYTWTIVINSAKADIDPDYELFFVDTIPDGMEFIDGSLSFYSEGVSNNNDQFYPNQGGTATNVSAVNNVLGPICVSDLYDEYTYRNNTTIGISGLATTIIYKTKLTDDELNDIKGSTTTQNYTNEFKVTDSTGNTILAQDSETATYDYQFLTKYDLSDENINDIDRDIINFQIDVNKDELTLNNGSPLTLTDTLNTNIELITKGIYGKYEFTVVDKNNNDLIEAGTASVSYNDDSRTITVTVPDSTYVKVNYSVKTRATGDIVVNNEAKLIGGGNQYSDSTSEQHHVSSHSATIQGGGIKLHKIDEHNITKELPGAVFKLYEVPFDATTYVMGDPVLVETGDITSTDGYYTISEDYLSEGKLFYWQEVTPPTGYVLDDTPHYFVAYNSGVLGSYEAAKTIDNGVQNANIGVTVNTVELGSYVWTVCNRKPAVQTGNLKISKTVVSDLAADANKEFEFTVTLSGTGASEVTGTKGDITFTGGVGTVKLKKGESAIATGLPVGLEYTVVETPVEGFTTSATADSGSISTTPSEAKFTNKRNTGNFELTKNVVSDIPSDSSKEFEFVITLDDDTISGTYGDVTFTSGVSNTFKLSDSQSVSVEGLPITLGYSIQETLDEAFSTDHSEGKFEGNIVKDGEKVVYTNTRKTGEIKVSKTVESVLDSDKTKEFEFVITLTGEGTGLNGKYSEIEFTNGVSQKFTLSHDQTKTISGLPAGVGYIVTEKAEEYFTTVKTGDKGTISTTTSNASFTNTRQTGGLQVYKFVHTPYDSDQEIEFEFTVTLSDTTFNYDGIGEMRFVDGVSTFKLKNGESIRVYDSLPAGITYTVVEKSNSKFVAEYGPEYTGKIKPNDDIITTVNNYIRKGIIKVDKKFISVNNKTDTFYFGLFRVESDGSETLYFEDPVKSTGSITGNTDGMTNTIEWGGVPYGNYKVYETDASGNKIAANSPILLTYEVSDGGLNGISVQPVDPNTSFESLGTITNTERVGDIEITKKYISAEGNTNKFYFQLYKVENETETAYGDIVSTDNITGTLEGATGTVEWTNIPYGTYKVYEVDSSGNKVTSDTTMTVVGSGQSIVVNADTVTGTITNTENVGSITATKKFVSPSGLSDTFYLSLFKVDGGNETLYKDVATAVKSTGSMTGSATGVSKTVHWDGIPFGTYKVYETDDSGNKIVATSSLLLEYSVDPMDGYSVELDLDSEEAGTFTNTERTGNLTIQKTFGTTSDLKEGDVDDDELLTFRVQSTTLDPAYDQVFDYTDFINGSKTITGLKTDTYKVTETSNLGGNNYTRVTTVKVDDGTATEASNISASVTAGKTTVVTFDNTYTIKRGKFSVYKDVDGSDTEESFPMTVTLIYPDGYAPTNTVASGQYRYDGSIVIAKDIIDSDPDVEVSGNVVTVKISLSENGGGIDFLELPYGTTYTVSENLPANSAYRLKSIEYGTGTDTNGIIKAVNNDMVAVTNELKPVDTVGEFTVTKNLTGSASNIAFSMIVTLTYPDGKAPGTYVDDAVGKFNIAGVAFSIYGNNSNVISIDGNVVKVSINLSKGQTARFYEIPFGTTYSVTEEIPSTAADVDYAGFENVSIAYGTGSNATSLTSGTVSTVDENPAVTVNNEYVGKAASFTVTKVDSDSGSFVPGAKISVYKLNGDSETQVGTGEYALTSTGTTIPNLDPSATFVIRETTVPAGYLPADDIKVTFTYAGNNQYTPTFTVGNTDASGTLLLENEQTEISIAKVDIANGEEIPGATIQIIKTTSEGETVVKEWVSTDNPQTITGLETGVTYTLRETVAPDGYSITTDTTFRLKADGTLDDTATTTTVRGTDGALLVEDTKTKVLISKVDATNEEELSGAKIEIHDEDGNVVASWTSVKGEKHEVEGLLTGKTYTLVETVAPNGYNIATSTTFKLDEYGKVVPADTTAKIKDASTNYLLVEDWPLSSFGFSKYGYTEEDCSEDKDDSAVPLEGAKFTATKLDSQGLPSQDDDDTFTSESNSIGNVAFKNLPDGIYQVKEVAAAPGYELSDETFYAKVAYGNDPAKSLYTDKACTKLVTNNRVYNDMPKADLTFKKVSEADPSKKLPGSTYGLFRKGANGQNKLVAKRTTGSDGSVTFEGVFLDTEYTVQELEAPDGYYVSKNPIALKIKKGSDGTITTELVSDGNGTIILDANGNLTWLEPEVIVTFAKVDEDGNPVEGAVLKVTDADGNDIKDADGNVLTWTTTRDVYKVSGVFVIGESYNLIEVKAPDGYELAAPVTFTISDETVAPGEEKVVEVSMTDKKSTTDTTVTSTKKKTGDSVPLPLLITLLAISLIAIVVIIIIRKRKSK